MTKPNDIIEGISEAMRFVRDTWINERFPVWEGDVHDFMANVIDERVSLFDVLHILASISNGDHIEELHNVFVTKDRMGKIRRISIRKGKPLTNQDQNP